MKVEIVRNVEVPTYPFTDYFKDFEKVETVRRIFGERTEEVLRNLRVEFIGRMGYMGISDVDGHLIINADYLNEGDIIDIYLHVIHELVHVRQFMEGKELFYRNYRYIDWPTEIEAYRYAIEEARNLGLSDEKICEYLRTDLRVRDNDENLKRLAKTLGVKCETF